MSFSPFIPIIISFFTAYSIINCVVYYNIVRGVECCFAGFQLRAVSAITEREKYHSIPQ